jgi:hypothetical protein
MNIGGANDGIASVRYSPVTALAVQLPLLPLGQKTARSTKGIQSSFSLHD